MVIDESVRRGKYMDPLQIEKESLLNAMEYSDGYAPWFLDKETGEIFQGRNEFIMGEDEEEFQDMLEDEPDRYLEIEPLSSDESYEIMEDFIKSLSDGSAKSELSEIMLQTKSYANFIEIIEAYMEVKDQWVQFHEEALLGRASEWLDAEGLEYEFVDFM